MLWEEVKTVTQKLWKKFEVITSFYFAVDSLKKNAAIIRKIVNDAQ